MHIQEEQMHMEDTKTKIIKVGLGSYHYHCGGHPAHLHPNGVCPYSSSSSSKSNNNKSTTSSSSNKNVVQTTAPAAIAVTGININEKVESLEVGESQTLTATITPNNATDKKITWKSSDESIATINDDGVVTTKKAGYVNITVSSSNGKTDAIKIKVEEVPKVENNYIIDKTNTYKNETEKNSIQKEQNTSTPDATGGIIAVGLLGGGYLGYKKYKKSK